MIAVSPFEAALLRILSSLLGASPPGLAVPLLADRLPAPPGLSSAAMGLVQEHLAKGCASFLVRSGGWRRERFVAGNRIVEGRLWERTTPEALALRFSSNTIKLLIALTAHAPKDFGRRWKPMKATLTVGDRLVVFIAGRSMTGSEVGASMRALVNQIDAGLYCLAFPLHLGFPRTRVDGLHSDLNFGRWLTPSGVILLECLQDQLARSWFAMEVGKAAIVKPRCMSEFASFQDRVLRSYLRAIDAAGRRDLARFLLVVGRKLFGQSDGVEAWTAALPAVQGSLRERHQARREAATLATVLTDLGVWQRQAQGIGFTDDNYEVGQLCKQLWETQQGDKTLATAAAIAREAGRLGLDAVGDGAGQSHGLGHPGPTDQGGT